MCASADSLWLKHTQYEESWDVAICHKQQQNAIQANIVILTDIYRYVPIKVSATLHVLSNTALTPKSVILTSPLWFISRFEGFKSRWIMCFLLWRYHKPFSTYTATKTVRIVLNLKSIFLDRCLKQNTTCLQIAARYGSGIMLTFFRKSARDPPSMYSKTM